MLVILYLLTIVVAWALGIDGALVKASKGNHLIRHCKLCCPFLIVKSDFNSISNIQRATAHHTHYLPKMEKLSSLN